MLQNEYLLAKIGADPAENELQKDPKTRHLKDVNGDSNLEGPLLQLAYGVRRGLCRGLGGS